MNEFEIIRLYGELFFDDALGRDALGNTRPLSLRYGIHNFEFLDRRLIGNNQWRNTTNAFQGFHGSLGQESNDWQVDLLAVQALNRSKYEWDRPVEQQWMYAVIGHWRGWSDVITLEPFYLALNQSAHGAVAERLVHSPGLRGYGVIPGTRFDFDFDLIYQTGRSGSRDMEAYAGNIEIGYSFDSVWKPGSVPFTATRAGIATRPMARTTASSASSASRVLGRRMTTSSLRTSAPRSCGWSSHHRRPCEWT